jgi:PKD repeat protein
VDTTSGVAPFHRYTAAGTYTVTLTVTDNEGATSTVTKQIVIVGGDGGGPNGDADGDGIANQDDSDADGDGFSNDIEVTANTNPYDGASLPFGAATPPEPLLLGKVLIGLDFANNGKDSIQLSGLLPVPENAVLNGAQVLLNVGGVAETFLINGKGQGRNAASSLTIQVKQKNGIIAAQNAKFSAKLSKGTYREQLKDEKLTATTAVTNAPRTILVALLVNTLGKHYQQVIDLSFTAKNGKGKAGTVKK